MRESLEHITPLILTYNEAPNIGRTLSQLGWARDIVVVDSFSDDATLEIVKTFPQARVYQRQFDTHENQWNFGLRETAIDSEWVLGLDADYVLTDEFSEELLTLKPQPEITGYRSSFIYCVNGKRLRCGVYPPVTVLYRKNNASYVQDGHTHRVVVAGRVENLRAAILHDDRKPLGRWLAAQSSYTKLEADKLLASSPDTLSWNDRIRRWRVLAPSAMLFYCLIIRGGVLDGWAGVYYAFQRSLAELMLSLYLIEHDLGIGDRVGHSSEFEKLRPAPENTPNIEGQPAFPVGSPKSEVRNS
ncbi:MAG TPA: glycosyltransferase family 2 protein [Pyrinomonadaceae bacterium]|jgi:glycosyltransferase involved in cell wall biosynthesis|nr:glycosyltransferase family 2 protein [Pyrinomonadaceae bacterium]